MKHKFKILIFALLLLTPAITSSSDLYHEEINYKAEEGKDLIMSLDEIEREDKFSIVRVKHTSGASVPSIMFVTKGFYEIAKLRSAKYFINLKEWQDGEGYIMYKMGYTSEKNSNPKKYFGEDMDSSEEIIYLSVEDCARLFERKK